MEDYWEQDSEVPVRPLPEEKMREAQGRTDWSEDEYENEDELEMQMDAKDIEKMVVAERKDEVELDETLYAEKMTVKELQLARKERQLPYSGSKRRPLDRLIAFKVNLESQMKLSIASKSCLKSRRESLQPWDNPDSAQHVWRQERRRTSSSKGKRRPTSGRMSSSWTSSTPSQVRM